jgi:hypothetical protein
MIRSVTARKRRVCFVETGFTGGTNFTVVRYSVSKSGVPSKSKIRPRGNLAKAYKRQLLSVNNKIN